MLNFRKLRTDFAPNTLKEGKQLWEKGAVKEAKVALLTSSDVQLTCKVVGNFDHQYTQDLEIDRQESILVDSSCSCAEGFDCSHLAACIFYLEEHLESLLVNFSEETTLEGYDDDDEEEKALILDTIKEAKEKEAAKKSQKRDKELYEEYVNASVILSHSPFFLTEDHLDQDIAELSILFNLEEARKNTQALIEFQLALRLPYRSKPLIVTEVKEFFDAVRYQEPIWIQHKRYFLPTSSFDRESAHLLQILLTHARTDAAKGDKVGRTAHVEREVFATLLAESFTLAQVKNTGSNPDNSDEELPPLPRLFGATFDEPLRYGPGFAKVRFNLHLVSSPVLAILLDPELIIDQKSIPIEQAQTLECSKPGLLHDHTFYRFGHKIKRKHLRSLSQIQQMAIPEPLFGTFIENSLPELMRYAEVSNKELLDQIVTLPFGGELKGECRIEYLDGELEAHVSFVYDDIVVPYASSQLKVDEIYPFVSTDGVIARNLTEEQKIIDDLFQDFAFDQPSGVFRVKSEKKIVEFMTETIPRYQDKITFHCPENLKDQFLYDDTEFRLHLKEANKVNAYTVELEVDGPLQGVTVDQLWDCIATKQSFIELPSSKESRKKGKKGKAGRYLVLNLDKLAPVVQIFDEIGINNLDSHKEERPLWSLVMVSDEQFKGLPIQLKMSPKLYEMQQQMLGLRAHEAQPIPKIIQAELRSYQKEGVEWLERLRCMHLNGILADDMGLGKTLQAIIAITQHHKDHPEAKSIVVCPTSLIYNWKEEFTKFNPKLRVLTVDGTPTQRKKLINCLSKFDVVVTSYSLIQKDIEYYETVPFAYAILDEAQHIKNRSTRNAKSVKSLSASHRLILTGTPVENTLDELWSLFDFLMPGLLSSYDRFVEKYIRIPRTSHKEAMETLKKKVSPFILRRMKKDVLAELPPVSEMLYHCHLTESQSKLYRSYANSAREELSQLVKKEGFDKVQIHVLATLTRLKQICCHPAIFAKEAVEPGDSAKYEMLMELMESLLEGGHKTVIFSQYTKMLQIMSQDLKERGINFSYLDGASKNRLGIVKEFNENESIPVFLVSLKAGGSGLNLTGADTVIHYDMWWNPAVENQATDRVHRMGQKKSVSSYKLVTKGTIEEKIVDLQKRKKGLVTQVVSTDDEALAKLTWEEVLELLQT